MKRYRFMASDDSGVFTDLQTGEVVDAWELDNWVCCSASDVADLERRHAELRHKVAYYIEQARLWHQSERACGRQFDELLCEVDKLRAELDEAVKMLRDFRSYYTAEDVMMGAMRFFVPNHFLRNLDAFLAKHPEDTQ